MLLHHEFVRVAKRFGDKLAFVDRSMQREVTYSRALIGALLAASKFRRYEDGYLGIMLPTSVGCGISILGALMSGKVPVMINYSTGAEGNARYAQHKCGFKTIITARALLEKINCPEVEGMVFIEDLLGQATAAQRLRAAAKSRLPANLLIRSFGAGSSSDDTVIVLFTSGSEKDPKAVQLSHKNIGSNAVASMQAYGCSSEDRMMAILPLFHVFGQTTTFWLPLLAGMTIVTYANPLEFKNVAAIIREERPTLVVGTPYFLMGYLKQASAGDFGSLRLAVAGADKVPAWLRRAYLKEHEVEVFEGYGTTETSPVISANVPGANRPGSIGMPLPGVEVKITGVDSGDELPTGSEGKILVRGDLVMKGYLGDVEETVLRIEGGWYETGDMGVFDPDGYLWHRGRLKRFIKIGGEMVSLVQVETVLQELLPDDIECCAVEIPDAKKGARVGVAITREIDQKETTTSLAKHLSSLALPKHFFVVDELPKMGSGKIDFRKTTDIVISQLEDLH